MKKMNISRFVCVGGVLTTLTVLFQSAPVFLPGIGLALSPLSTLPVAVAAASDIFLGTAVFFSSAVLLFLVSTQESIILLLTTGLLGIVTGTLLYRKGIIISIVFSSIALFPGIVVLTYITGISEIKVIKNPLTTLSSLMIILLFSLVYAGVWNIILYKFNKYLRKIKLHL